VPKIVDHEERRRELAAAVWRVICSRGPEAVTIRDVATEAGWSSGALRHYLPTRDALLLFAFEQAAERAAARIRAAGDAPLAELLEQTLPLDEERRQEAVIWFAFVGIAPSHPELAASLDLVYDQILDWLASKLDGRDRRSRASALFAAVDGIAVQTLAMPGRMTPARQRAALRLHVDAILGS
jgi:AcrR family transcriptional regulator